MVTVRLEWHFAKINLQFWNINLEESEYEFFQQDDSTFPPPFQYSR
jgi:hypothetical protein